MNTSLGNRLLLLGMLFAAFVIPVFPADQIAWVKNFDAALNQAEKEKKFIVLDMSASW